MYTLKTNGFKVLCWDPFKKKYMSMGALRGDTLVKTVTPVHFMKVVGGYGFQYDAFSELVSTGTKRIEIKEKHTGNSWLSSSAEWALNGHIADYGRGKQIFLSLKYMKLKTKKVSKIDCDIVLPVKKSVQEALF